VISIYKTGGANDYDHKQIILQHYLYLVEHLNTNSSGLVDELSQAKVISKQDRDRITSEMSVFMQNAKLLSVLSHKTKDKFDKFLNALDKTGQQHLHNHILGRKGKLFNDNVLFI